MDIRPPDTTKQTHLPEPQQRKLGAVVGCRDERGRWLLIRRSAHVIAPNRICFPGGTIEPGEAPDAAAIREMQEELGVSVSLMELVWDFMHPDKPLHLHGFLGRLGHEPLRPAEREVAEVVWMSRREVLESPDVLPYTERFVEALEEAWLRLG